MKPRSSRNITNAKNNAPDPIAIFMLANTKWEKGQEVKAFELFLKAAELGEPSAQHNVGYFYDNGLGIKKNVNKALFWYKKSWKAQHQTSTCINIAQLYASRGKKRSAVLWWNKAVRLGDGDAALDLAKFYLSRRMMRDQRRAHPLLQKVLRAHHVTPNAIDEATALLSAAKRRNSD